MNRIALCAALLCAACSPVYVMKSAAGHAGLLWRRRSVDAMIADPKTPEAQRAKLKLVREVRAFAFEEMGLSRGRAYSTVTPVEGCCVTFVVSACEKTSFNQYQWWFPILGRVPYKGYFHKADAQKEAGRLEKRGLDASVGGVSAYHTGLWISDPLPSSVLDDPPGELASLIIHELTHGTIFFKNAVDFDESLAEFVGNQGAQDFLARRFGAASPELKEFRANLASGKEFDALVEGAYKTLDALYKSPAPREEKLARREEVFSALVGKLGKERVNNAFIVAHRIYHEQTDDFKRVYERNGRDWKKTISTFKALDPKDPRAALRL